MTESAIIRVLRDGLCEETFEQRSEGSEGASHVGIWQKRILGRGNSKSSEIGMCPTDCGTAQRTAWLEHISEGDSGGKRRT